MSCDPASCSACAAGAQPAQPAQPCSFTRYTLQLGTAAGTPVFQVERRCAQLFVSGHFEQLERQQRCTVVVHLDSAAGQRRLRATASWHEQQQQPEGQGQGQGQGQPAPELVEQQEPELGQEQESASPDKEAAAGAWCWACFPVLLSNRLNVCTRSAR